MKFEPFGAWFVFMEFGPTWRMESERRRQIMQDKRRGVWWRYRLWGGGRWKMVQIRGSAVKRGGRKGGGRREDRLMNIYETFSGVKERSNHRRALYWAPTSQSTPNDIRSWLHGYYIHCLGPITDERSTERLRHSQPRRIFALGYTGITSAALAQSPTSVQKDDYVTVNLNWFSLPLDSPNGSYILRVF